MSLSKTTTAAASPAEGEDPFRDPTPPPRRPKSKRARWRGGRARGDWESLDSVQDSARDLPPMRLIDADDFRLP
ncbi:hypothetical protein SAMD00023353_0100230 [Rosellinia necatrix]|uniref:Uncharacterized protein n=1 Tax=Rosellinia necatrix TaxID=77044 RepID=A0A1S7UHZ0_ROSNE|nr:hypothetical protein SAMD00023353_0100230 [Rosellinia necatrix]